MNNEDIAACLKEIAALLELKNESSFRVRAYDNAGRTLGGLTEDVQVIAAEGRLPQVKGIGKGIAEKITELLETGHIAYLEELRQVFPPGVRTLMNVPGVGPSIARRVYQELGVDSIEALRVAAESGALASMPGLGEKSAQNVIRSLSRANKAEDRISIGRAVPVVESLMQQLRESAPVDRLEAGGSLRRWAPTIGDIDLMATSEKPEEVMDAFVQLPQVRQVLARGATKSAIVTDNGLQVDLRIIEAQSFGSLLQHFTGSKNHNIELRDYALQRGQSLNEYGIVTVETGKLTPFSDEREFYAALDLDYVPPELREGTGEIQAARKRSLPDLISVADIRGDLHMHTDWSDGALPVEEMVVAAQAHGYEYLAITDHSGGMALAGGLNEERIGQQYLRLEEVRKLVPGIHILAGSEVDIKRDGTLDFPNEVLAKLDWVIASVHSGFNQSRQEMTERILSAIENPFVHAIAHPTGRLIGKRSPYEVDLEAVFAAAARTRTALEINSFPERLDLSDTQARRATELGVMLVVNTDAHAQVHLDNMRFGVAMARRAWARAGNVLNSLPLAELRAWLKRDVP
ncbi:MAG: DNA polymerase/3'-5' exonuclease PolX [Chloroflexota bacterium]